MTPLVTYVATYCSRSADAGVAGGMEVGFERDGQVRGGCWNADRTGALWTRPVEGVWHDLHCLRINILYLKNIHIRITFRFGSSFDISLTHTC